MCDGLPATIVGTNGADVLDGTAGNDVIVGLGGNDVIRGFGGSDVLCGGPGRDRLFGGLQKDRLFGGENGDLLHGDAGADVLFGDQGNDRLIGGNGDDQLTGGRGNVDRLSGRNGRDLCLDSGAVTFRESCETSTFEEFERRKVPPPTSLDTTDVIFLGDSVTAGFGFCGTEFGSLIPFLSCDTNEELADSWSPFRVSLASCLPPAGANDRCSNNSAHGMPWDAGYWTPGTDQSPSPEVAFPYVIAAAQDTNDMVSIQNWAMTGATPRDWDPVGAGLDSDGDSGRFGQQLSSIRNSYVVMTLGANPLLSDHLKIGTGLPLFPEKVGVCSEDTVSGRGTNSSPYRARPLTDEPGGVAECFNERWMALDQSRHLRNIYETLLRNDNHVLVLGYPLICPWTFGNWQPVASPFGPSHGRPCDSLADPATGISQWDQASFLVDELNDRIAFEIQTTQESMRTGNIDFALPNPSDWALHQGWTDGSWVFQNDTWIHPSVPGHLNLADTVVAATCQVFDRWCGPVPLQWGGAA